MKSENYHQPCDDSAHHTQSFEEQLLLSYDNYLNGSYCAAIATSNHYNLELGELDDDYVSEYDENDWEEESDEDFSELEEDQDEPGTFLM